MAGNFLGTAKAVKEPFGDKLNLPPYRGRIRSGLAVPAYLLELAAGERLLDRPDTEILLEGRNRVGLCRSLAPAREGDGIVVKEFRIQGVDRLKSLILPSKASKAWRGSHMLQRAGIGTPLPVAYLDRRQGLFMVESVFISEWLSGAEEIRGLLTSLRERPLEIILEQLARFLLGCHARGIMHRDLSDGNVLVRKVDDDRWNFFLIDTNRIRRRRRIGLWRGLRNLIRLGIPRQYQRYFLRYYLRAPMVNRLHMSWYRINKRFYTGYMASKKRLRVKQIARKLKIQ